MEKMKQISAKIDAETLDKIDALALKDKYWKRNAIINGILTSILDACTPEQIMLLVRYWKHDRTTLPLITIQKNEKQI